MSQASRPTVFYGPKGEPPRYLVFSGAEYYALGGWRDLQAAFLTRDTALEAANQLPDEHWVEVIDLATMLPIYSRGEAYGVRIENPFAPTIDGDVEAVA